MDYYLKFDSEAQSDLVLYDAETKAPKFDNINTVGIIYKPTGKTVVNKEGEYPEMVPIDGWHVNVRVIDEDDSALKPYMVTPTTPMRIWG